MGAFALAAEQAEELDRLGAGGWGADELVDLHCPYCHGWEVRDQAVGVLATGPRAVHQALLFRQWSADVTFLSHATAPPADEEAAQLAGHGIGVVEGEVASLEVVQDRLVGGAADQSRLVSSSARSASCTTTSANPRQVSSPSP